MAKLLSVVMISILVKVKCNSNAMFVVNECTCSDINSNFVAIQNTLDELKEQLSRRACPSGFDYLPGADACYRVIFRSLNWHDSSQVCKSVMPGVHLAAITSAEKQQAIENYLEEQFNKDESSACLISGWPDGGKSVWISGQTKDPNRCDSPYVWKTLNAVEIPFNYTNWLDGEPSCTNNAEKCAHIAAGRDYAWNDSQCNSQSCALCEF